LSVYHLDTERLARLRPDVVLTCLQTAHSAVLEGELLAAALRAVLGYAPRVVHLAADEMEGVWRDMLAVAAALGAAAEGEALVAAQRRRMEVAAAGALGRPRPRVACVQWHAPLLAAGAWVPELVAQAGGADVCGRAHEAVPLSAAALEAAAPDVVVFALCGLPLGAAARAAAAAAARLGGAWAALPAVRAGRVAVVDGAHVLSRPGPLLASSVECLVEILHPEAQRHGHESRLWQWLPAP
jgi:iron complex transport system substrate-binding protein